MTVTQYAKKHRISRQAVLKQIATGKLKAKKKKIATGRYGSVWEIIQPKSRKQLKLKFK